MGLGYLYLSLGDFIDNFVKPVVEKETEPAPKSATLKRRKSERNSQIELTDIVIRKASNHHQSAIFNQGSLEVDPNRMTDEDDTLVNSIMLQLNAQKLLLCVFRSSNTFPASICDIFKHLMTQVEENLTREDAYNSVAGFTFLRLVNPSILFPHQYGLSDTAPRDESITRQLVLLAKVLQNLVSLYLFPFFFFFFFTF